jgi:uncharacterized protein involved in exopolysaccharide biosynthesis
MVSPNVTATTPPDPAGPHPDAPAEAPQDGLPTGGDHRAPEAASSDLVGSRPPRRRSAGGRSRRPVVVLAVAAVAGAVLGGLGSLVAGPTYSSSADVLYNPAGVRYVDETINADPNLLERQVTDQVDVVQSDSVLQAAAGVLDMDVDDLREDIRVEVTTGSSTIEITGRADTAEGASDVAGAVTDAYVASLKTSGASVLEQRAQVLQGTIDRQNTQLADLDAQLSDLNDQLGGLNPQSAAYGAVQGRIDRLATQIEDLTTRNADLVDQQETLRANAEIFPGEAFVVRQAETPKGPSSLTPPKAALVGAALGLVIGGCVLVFRSTRGRSSTRSTSTDA